MNRAILKGFSWRSGLAWMGLWLISMPLIEWFSPHTPLPAELYHKDTMSIFQNLVLVALWPAIWEEVVFRGILQGGSIRLWNKPHLIIFIVAALFAAVHFQAALFLPRFIFGLFLGYAYYQSGSLWLPLCLHFLNNAIIVLYTVFYLA